MIDDDEGNRRERNGNEYFGDNEDGEDGGYEGADNEDEDEEGTLERWTFIYCRGIYNDFVCTDNF